MQSSFSEPYLNRFLQPDSIIPDQYNPQSLNRYSYVGNNPINRTDPSGHESGDCYDRGYCGPDNDGTLWGGKDYDGLAWVDKNMNPSSDSVITAAGMAVQSQYYNPYWDNPKNPASSSYGPAQLGKDDYPPGADPLSIDVAIAGMQKRIETAQALCLKLSHCDATDLIIVAAMAQNGPGGSFSLKDVIKNTDGSINWDKMFIRNPKGGLDGIREILAGNRHYDTSLMLSLYLHDLQALLARGWKLPASYKGVNWNKLKYLAQPPKSQK